MTKVFRLIIDITLKLQLTENSNIEREDKLSKRVQRKSMMSISKDPHKICN